MINEKFYTFLGVLTILMWSCNNYPFRSMIANMGSFSGIGVSCGFGGFLGLIIYFVRSKYDRTIKFTQINKVSIGIIALFVLNMIFSSLVFGISPVGDILLQTSVINYLWVIIANVLLVVILKYKIKYMSLFLFGNLLALIGIVVVCIGFDFSRINFTGYFIKYYYCYVFAIISAMTWGIYSIVVKKYSNTIEDDVFISMVLTGIIRIAISFCDKSFNNYGNIKTNFKNIGFLLYEIIFISYLAYYFWGIAIRRGNSKILSNISLLAPVISVISTSLFYELQLLGNVIYGTIILVSAIAFCKYSISDYIEDGQELYSLDSLETV